MGVELAVGGSVDPERVRTLRNGKGWSQATLAEKAGVSQAAVSDLERGSAKSQPDTLQKVARALGVELDALLRSRDDTAIPRPYEMARNIKPEEIGEPVTTWVPVVRDIARAGVGGLDPELVITRLPVPPQFRERAGKLVFVTINGDCLEPTIMPGDMVLVELERMPRDGQIALVRHEGELMVKYAVVDTELWGGPQVVARIRRLQQTVKMRQVAPVP